MEQEVPKPFEVTTTWTGGIRTRSKIRGHEVVTDGPYWRYGTNDGPAPGELMLASVGACYINHMVRYLQFKRIMVNRVKSKVMSSFRLHGELEIIDKISIRTTVRAAPRYKDVVEKAFKVAQNECTILMILDIEKEFELVFEPGEERS
jgi:uncharacterized OsmC-like protein